MDGTLKTTKGDTKKNKGPKGKALIDSGDQLRSVKKVLDRVLQEADSLPNDIRQKIVSARDSIWEAYKKDEEAINSTTR